MSDVEVRVVNTPMAANDVLKQGGWRVVTALQDAKTGQWQYVLALMEGA